MHCLQKWNNRAANPRKSLSRIGNRSKQTAWDSRNDLEFLAWELPHLQQRLRRLRASEAHALSRKRDISFDSKEKPYRLGVFSHSPMSIFGDCLGSACHRTKWRAARTSASNI